MCDTTAQTGAGETQQHTTTQQIDRSIDLSIYPLEVFERLIPRQIYLFFIYYFLCFLFDSLLCDMETLVSSSGFSLTFFPLLNLINVSFVSTDITGELWISHLESCILLHARWLSIRWATQRRSSLMVVWQCDQCVMLKGDWIHPNTHTICVIDESCWCWLEILCPWTFMYHCCLFLSILTTLVTKLQRL